MQNNILVTGAIAGLFYLLGRNMKGGVSEYGFYDEYRKALLEETKQENKAQEWIDLMVDEEGKSIVDEKDKRGRTMLWEAAEAGNNVVVNVLLKNGADINKADKHGVTPLAIASAEGQESVVKTLLKKNASINKSAKNGFTPLAFAVRDNQEKVVKLLLKAGAKATKEMVEIAKINKNNKIKKLLC